MNYNKSLPKAFIRARYGVDTWGEFFMRIPQRVARFIKKCSNYPKFYSDSHVRRLSKKFTTKDCIKIKDVRLPLLDEEHAQLLWIGVWEDTFASYYYFDDRYDEEIFKLCEKLFGEGLYGLVNDKVSVQVNPGDIVIDAGSWIGDFAAYSAIRGGVTFAFEPSEGNFKYLQQTAELNPNIFPIKKGLSDKTTTQKFFFNNSGNTGADSLMDKSQDKNFEAASDLVETITLDDFVKEKNLERVDFIKSDIEGFERNMLQGAQETLKNFAPKLALCTYHLPDDPEVMTDLIMRANPNYEIVYGRKKLYASV